MFAEVKHRNEQLKQNLFSLAREGNEDHTEIRLLKDAFDIPRVATSIPKPKMSAAAAASNSSTRKFGTPLKDNKPSSTPFSKRSSDFDRLTSLRKSVNNIKNTRYELPSKGESTIKNEAKNDNDVVVKESYEVQKEERSPKYRASYTSPPKNKNLLLSKLESKNLEIERLNEKINNLLLENQKLSNNSYDAEDEKLTIIKQHEQEVEKRSQIWHEKLNAEKRKNLKLYETITIQAKQIEELRRAVAKSDEKREAITDGLKNRMLYLKDEYNKVVHKVEDLESENKVLAKQLNSNMLTSPHESVQSNEVNEFGEVEESTTEIINGCFRREISDGALIEGRSCNLEPDSTTELLVSG